jgi:excisionase family DNA binding protein
MADDHSSVLENVSMSVPSKSLPKAKPTVLAPQFLSTAEAARMLGLSTTLVQTLVDQGDLKGWKTRGGHRRISLDSIVDYQAVSRYSFGSQYKQAAKPKVTVVIESPSFFEQLQSQCSDWKLPVDVNFFDSVTEALLELSSQKPDMMVVEMSMPRAQQEKTLQALENFNQRGHAPLSVVLITAEKDLASIMPSGVSSSIQVVSGPLSDIWLHAYLTGILASYRA